MTAKMVMRSFRADEELWNTVTARAKADGVKVSEVLRTALEQYATTDDDESDDTENGERFAAIVGTGRLSESEDPETQAAVTRVAELLREGAVGVSIAHDMNPDDMPSRETIDALIDAEDWDGLDALMDDVRIRPRHVAVVDTPAFSDARLALGDDGLSVTGPVVFEGPWTGDQRLIPFGSLVWDEDLLPIPIIWDREDGDHTGTVVGSISALERVDGETSNLRPKPVDEESVEAVTAAAGSKTGFPARLVARWTSGKVEPIHVDAPDADGMRRVWGHAAPKGVCFRDGKGDRCFQYPGDVDKEHRGFHTGALVELDNGQKVRMGALTSGGMHVDSRLHVQGVGAREVFRHREDSTKVLAMVRAWEDPHGLAISGVLTPGVSEKELVQAMACAPSVELWPSGRGRTLVGIHLVPTPAWPVAASAGEVVEFAGPAAVEVDGLCTECVEDEEAADGEITEDQAEQVNPGEGEVGTADETPAVNADGDTTQRLDRIEQALAMLVADKLTASIPNPTAEDEAE